MKAARPAAPRAVAAKRRRCILTRHEDTTDGMIRFVAGPDRRIAADLAERLPGRGLWLSANRTAIEEARTKGAFARAARGPVVVDENLAGQVDEQLAQRALNYLGLALRASVIAIGHDQVRADITVGRAALLLQAADGAVQPRARMRALAHGLPVVEIFTRGELAQALGREDLVHAALRPSPLTDRLLRECRRLGGFREAGERQDELQDREGSE